MSASDPTYVPVVDTNSTDPFVRRLSGHAYHPIPYGTPIDVPYISKILPGFYQGGCRSDLVLPTEIEYVVSLYKWEKYKYHSGVKAVKVVEMYDSEDEPDVANVRELAELVNLYRSLGNTLVHCQAGLNRSGLIAAAALVLQGDTPRQAINLLRETRGSEVLCNPVFEQWLLHKFQK